jgi:hypothetical protein
MPVNGLVCRRCGFVNAPGDAFCGSCAAFLEWEGEPATAGAPPMTVDDAVAPATVPAEVTAPDLALLRCPACGIANPPTRTFCQSCGSRLADAARVGPPSAERIAAAVAAPVVAPVVVPTQHPASRPGATQAVTRQPGAGRSGLLGWLVVMAVLGVLVGVGVVVGGNLLKGGEPASQASTAPIASGEAAASPGSPGTGAGSGTGTDTTGSPNPSGEPSAETVEPEALSLTGAEASSVVGSLAKFAPQKAIDGDPKTSWQEGAAAEKGQWIEVTFAPSTVARVVLRNGYGASTALYKGNRRMKDVLISVDGGKPVKARLKDTGKPQEVDVTGPSGSTTVRITIVSTYPAVKTAVQGTPFDDCALSEVTVLGTPGE